MQPILQFSRNWLGRLLQLLKSAITLKTPPTPQFTTAIYLLALISASNSLVGLNCPRSSNELMTVGFNSSTILDFSIRYI
jgi:hypothetical protein